MTSKKRKSTGADNKLDEVIVELKAMRVDARTYWKELEKYHKVLIKGVTRQNDDRFVIKELFKALTIAIGAIVALVSLIKLAG